MHNSKELIKNKFNNKKSDVYLVIVVDEEDKIFKIFL